MDGSDAPPSVQALNSTYGVLFIGFILAVTLYGLTFFQTYVFYSRFPNDSPWTKRMVALLWLIDTATTGLISQMQYYYLIESFSSTFDELELTKTFVIEKALATVATFIVQMFYAIHARSYVGKWHAATLGIGFLTISSFAFGVASTTLLARRTHIADLITPELEVLLGVYEGLNLLCNIAIVGANFYFLGTTPKGNLNPGQPWFDRFVLTWVNRGTSSMLYQLVLFLIFVSMPHSQVWILFHFIISKCYINSLFSMLNSRKAHGGRGIYEDENVHEAVQTRPPLAVGHPPSIGHARQNRRNDLSVFSISRAENTIHSVQLPPSSEERVLDRESEADKDIVHMDDTSVPSTSTPTNASKTSL